MDTVIMKKYHGLGNDYLVLDPNKNQLRLQPRHIELLCRRNFGVGADGILYGPMPKERQYEAALEERQYESMPEENRFCVQIYNPDGSQTENSGNGIRIFAKYLLDEGYVKDSKVILSTSAEDVEVEFLEETGSRMRVNMGSPSFVGAAIPVVGMQDSEVINEPLCFHGNIYNTTCLSVGNPNCVIMMEEIDHKKAIELGPYVEHANYFPNRMNLQLLKVLDRGNIQIETYERGAGYTLASGTGACAAAAAAHRMGFTDRQVRVHMPGGELLIELEGDGTIFMTGSVSYVGEIRVSENFLALSV